MKKWLIGLAVAAGLGVIALLRSRSNRQKAIQNHHEAVEHTQSFLVTISTNSIEEIRNVSILIPGRGAWVNQYVGKVAGEEFQFDVLVEGAPYGDDSERRRMYALHWRGSLINALVDPSAQEIELNPFVRIQQLLEKVVQDKDSTQPL